MAADALADVHARALTYLLQLSRTSPGQLATEALQGVVDPKSSFHAFMIDSGLITAPKLGEQDPRGTRNRMTEAVPAAEPPMPGSPRPANVLQERHASIGREVAVLEAKAARARHGGDPEQATAVAGELERLRAERRDVEEELARGAVAAKEQARAEVTAKRQSFDFLHPSADENTRTKVLREWQDAVSREFALNNPDQPPMDYHREYRRIMEREGAMAPAPAQSPSTDEAQARSRPESADPSTPSATKRPEIAPALEAGVHELGLEIERHLQGLHDLDMNPETDSLQVSRAEMKLASVTRARNMMERDLHGTNVDAAYGPTEGADPYDIPVVATHPSHFETLQRGKLVHEDTMSVLQRYLESVDRQERELAPRPDEVEPLFDNEGEVKAHRERLERLRAARTATGEEIDAERARYAAWLLAEEQAEAKRVDYETRRAKQIAKDLENGVGVFDAAVERLRGQIDRLNAEGKEAQELDAQNRLVRILAARKVMAEQLDRARDAAAAAQPAGPARR
jgi:hypothetical protein